MANYEREREFEDRYNSNGRPAKRSSYDERYMSGSYLSTRRYHDEEDRPYKSASDDRNPSYSYRRYSNENIRPPASAMISKPYPVDDDRMPPPPPPMSESAYSPRPPMDNYGSAAPYPSDNYASAPYPSDNYSTPYYNGNSNNYSSYNTDKDLPRQPPRNRYEAISKRWTAFASDVGSQVNKWRSTVSGGGAKGLDTSKDNMAVPVGGYTQLTDTPQSPSANRRCKIVPQRPLYRILCGVITSVTLLVIIILAVVFWPQFPSIKVLSVQVANGQIGSSAAGVSFNFPPGSTDLNNITVKFDLRLNISCFNSNLYNLKVDLIDLNTFLVVNQTAIAKLPPPSSNPTLNKFITKVNVNPNYQPNFSPKVGAGNRTSIQFLSRKNVTFPMTLSVEYTPDPNTGLLKDPAFAEVLNVCGVVGRSRPAKINYVSTSKVAILQKFGYTPTINDNIFIQCPVTPDEIASILSQVNGDPSSTTLGSGRGILGAASKSSTTNLDINASLTNEEDEEEKDADDEEEEEPLTEAKAVQILTAIFAKRQNKPPVPIQIVPGP
ncbi:hypothetical protein HDU97_007591 [Phlyctochytrium planicorne]|nr:hypothetical protein HDU97_007591 [Phlyctochytrium planicorne]